MLQLHRCVRLLVTVSMLAGLAACVTTTESVFTDDASPKEAQQKRVALARQYIGEGNWDDAKRNLAIAVEINDKNAEFKHIMPSETLRGNRKSQHNHRRQ